MGPDEAAHSGTHLRHPHYRISLHYRCGRAPSFRPPAGLRLSTTKRLARHNQASPLTSRLELQRASTTTTTSQVKYRASSPVTMITPLKTEASLYLSTTDDNKIPAVLRCAYRSKPCSNLRATKVNGDLHKLCDHHRQRANINQQRVHLRRRLEKKHARQLQQRQAREHESSVLAPDSPVVVDNNDYDNVKCKSQCIDLSMQDLIMLELILSYEPPINHTDQALLDGSFVDTSSNSDNRVECQSFLEQLQFVM